MRRRSLDRGGVAAVFALLVALLAMAACHPAWSPDGKQLLYVTPLGNGSSGIAVYDCATRQSRVVFTAAGFPAPVALWDPDGKQAIVVTMANQEAKKVHLDWVMVVDGKVTRRLDVDGEQSFFDPEVLSSPTIVGHSLFLSMRHLVRVDLDSGAITRSAAEAGLRLAAMPCGSGLGYVEYRDFADFGGEWELGTIDPATLARTRTMRSQDYPQWRMQPEFAFSRDASRLAMLATDDKGLAVLTFANGKLEQVAAIGPDAEWGIADLTFAADGKTLFAIVGHQEANDAWSLRELNGGEATPDVVLFTTPHVRSIGPDAPISVALSPDGNTLAVVSPGLHLVDLTTTPRTVTHPIPPSTRLVIKGSDLMLELGQGWAKAYVTEHPDRLLDVSGGGTGAGFAGLLDGRVDIAMSNRPATKAVIDAAAKLGRELVEHRAGLADPMRLYTLGEPTPAARELLGWIGSDEGRAITARCGHAAK